MTRSVPHKSIRQGGHGLRTEHIPDKEKEERKESLGKRRLR